MTDYLQNLKKRKKKEIKVVTYCKRCKIYILHILGHTHKIAFSDLDIIQANIE